MSGELLGEIEIAVGDVNDVEAHVYARCTLAAAAGERVVLSGTLRGPYCAIARTLPAEFVFRELREGAIASARAVVPDPCLWSAELPHVYHAEVEARQGGQIVATFRGDIGLKRSTPRRGGMAFPG
jgi:beta-galactosidase/beta-glucuronidase